MYLKELKLWNYRKYGSDKPIRSGEILREPNLVLEFQRGFNLLVGENDSGKTAIIDAIKLILGTNSNRNKEYLEIEDFHQFLEGDDIKTSVKLRIECLFCFNSDDEAKNFLEWAHFDTNDEYTLRLFLETEQVDGEQIMSPNVKGGIDEDGATLDAGARELLKATYLKPLRDAKTELTAKRNSRLSQIFSSHKLAKIEHDTATRKRLKHPLEEIFLTANTGVGDFFTEPGTKESSQQEEAEDMIKVLNKTLQEFFGDGSVKSKVKISESTLKSILEKLELVLERTNAGLGSHNLLFIAIELILLEKDDDYTGLHLALIEEIEAHLHPQAQMRMIEYLQSECDTKSIQMLVTTHSTSLASKVDLKNLIICNSNWAYPMGKNYTKLEEGDYPFLERFLDTTKANLFFAKGVLLVEGDAENLLIPTFAKIVGKDLTRSGVSIVNLGNTAFKRYSRIFLRKTGKQMGIPVSVITDLDVKPVIFYSDNESAKPKMIKIDEGIIKKFTSQNSKAVLNEGELKGEYETMEAVKKKVTMTVTKQKTAALNFFIKKNLKEGVPINIDTDDKIKEYKAKAKVQKNLSEDNVHFFLAENWTLEYELALSRFKKVFYMAVLMAKHNPDTFDTDAIDDCMKKALDNIKEWKKNSKTDEEIAYEIYWIEMMKKGKNSLSKAIVAQYFAQILEINTKKDQKTRNNAKEIIETDSHLKYLFDAINYVVKP
jgi:putative ATP-dependent endonuclease of OLD family